MSNIDPQLNPQTIPGFVLWQVSKLWQRAMTKALQPFGIGSTEFVVLGNAVRLTMQGQVVTQTGLAEATKVDRMTISQTLRSLEKKGLLERSNTSKDKRTFHVVPTKAGIELADTALGGVIQAHSVFFAPLEGKAAPFLAAMQRLIEENNNESTR